MSVAEIIRRKRDGFELTEADLALFAQGAASGKWPDYQLAALLMAITIRSMSARETAWLTQAMVNSGTRVDLSDVPGPKVDKHSTGGVGDKTSLVVAPLAAACGVVVPMMSGRGLGHTGGTLDKLEAIPGFRVGLSIDEFRQALRDTGVAMIGQTAEVAPADRVLYALRDVTGTVESIPLLTSSILCKKIAEGISGLVLDVKCGGGAFMPTLEAARELAESLVSVGRANGVLVIALLTAMDAPLGTAVGNALEVAECLAILTPGSGRQPDDLLELCLVLAARMVRLAGVEPSDESARTRVEAALANGAALDVFRRMVTQQGGDPELTLPRAPYMMELAAREAGFVTGIDARAVGLAAMQLGAGRRAVTDRVDPAVGVEILARCGAKVSPGDPLIRAHCRRQSDLARAEELLRNVHEIGPNPPVATPLILGEIR